MNTESDKKKYISMGWFCHKQAFHIYDDSSSFEWQKLQQIFSRGEIKTKGGFNLTHQPMTY